MGQLHLRDQKTLGTEDLLDRTLRWMRENLDGANRAVHPPGHANEGKPCTNSGTAIIFCNRMMPAITARDEALVYDSLRRYYEEGHARDRR